MKILGLSHEHDSGAAFLEDAELIYAANEERFNRRKFTRALPASAIEAGRKMNPEFFESIDAVAVGSRLHVSSGIDEAGLIDYVFKILSRLRIDRVLFGTDFGVRLVKIAMAPLQIKRRFLVKRFLKEHGIYAPTMYVDHHLSHASGAYFTAPWDDCLVITLDAQGDGACSKVYIGRGGKLKEVHSMPFYHTPGYYYWCITLLLGFKQGREGKVTGLAARGDASKTLPIFEERISFDKEKCRFMNRGLYKREEYWYLKKRLAGFSREDIAAGMQRHLENLVCAYIKELAARYGGAVGASKGRIHLALSGGIFANVTLNNRIMELPEVAGIYIYPHMGDGGLAAGAAWALAARYENIKQKMFGDLYLGPRLEPAVSAQRLNLPLTGRVAQLLASGKTVAICRGRMEYGPRALGNRSILFQATDPTVNDWLNKKLKRSEFMPFAPILKKEYAGEYFKNWQKCEKALEFMIVALDTTDKCKREAPAIVHIDGTARPQIVTAETNPFIYKLLGEYEKLTGKRILINTSFNMHEEPIVCAAKDAMRAFKESGLDALILGDKIILKENY